MHLRQSTIVSRFAVEVWRCIIDPQCFQKWNEKIVSLEAKERFQRGQHFVTRYKWGSRELQCMSVAINIQEGRLLEIRHSGFIGPDVNPAMEVTERVFLEERGNRTVVIKDIFVVNHNIPWFFVLIIELINRFRRQVKEDKLESILREI